MKKFVQKFCILFPLYVLYGLQHTQNKATDIEILICITEEPSLIFTFRLSPGKSKFKFFSSEYTVTGWFVV